MSAPATAPPTNKAGGKGGNKRDESPKKMRGRSTAGKKEAVERVYSAEEKAAMRQKHIEEHCTRLHFVAKGGKMEEKLFETRLEHYSELQRLIAHSLPKTTNLYMCQFLDGSIITSQNFKSAPIYRVRDMDTVRPLKIKFCPRVDTRWDFLEFHAGKPPRWVDKMQEKINAKEKLLHDASNAKKLEADARKLMERLESGGAEEDSDGAFDDL